MCSKQEVKKDEKGALSFGIYSCILIIKDTQILDNHLINRLAKIPLSVPPTPAENRFILVARLSVEDREDLFRHNGCMW
jgi:hypothetical protein